MLDFKVNEPKCVKCGACSKDCPVSIIKPSKESGFPQMVSEKENLCLKCQHCLAVCPTAAISILGVDPLECKEIEKDFSKFEGLDNLIRGRRSVRRFKKESLSHSLLETLANSAAYAPTGHGDNGVEFHITLSKDETDRVRDRFYRAIKEADDSKFKGFFKMLINLQGLYESKGVDLLFRDAPHLVVSSAPANDVTPREDTIIGLSYFEILAASHNVGTLWNGFIKYILEVVDPSLKSEIGIPENHIVGYSMLVGRSDVNYQRVILKRENHLKEIKL